MGEGMTAVCRDDVAGTECMYTVTDDATAIGSRRSLESNIASARSWLLWSRLGLELRSRPPPTGEMFDRDRSLKNTVPAAFRGVLRTPADLYLFFWWRLVDLSAPTSQHQAGSSKEWARGSRSPQMSSPMGGSQANYAIGSGRTWTAFYQLVLH